MPPRSWAARRSSFPSVQPAAWRCHRHAHEGRGHSQNRFKGQVATTEHLRAVCVGRPGDLGHSEATTSSETAIQEIDEASWPSAGPCTISQINFIVCVRGDSMGKVEVAELYRFHRPARHNMIGSWTPITTSITPQGEIHEVKRTELETTSGILRTSTGH